MSIGRSVGRSVVFRNGVARLLSLCTVLWPLSVVCAGRQLQGSAESAEAGRHPFVNAGCPAHIQSSHLLGFARHSVPLLVRGHRRVHEKGTTR